MLLAVDIGNTNAVVGLFDGKRLKRQWRLSTRVERTSDELGLLLSGLFASSGLKTRDVKGAIISSVVPSMTRPYRDAVRDSLGVGPKVVGEDAAAKMPILVDNPAEVGADRIVNAVAAYGAHRGPLIIVDFGTAVTFDYVTPAGEYAGGAIAPGITISTEALFSRTARLPRVEPARPTSVVGRNTADAVRSGVYWGFIGLVDGIIARMKEEVKTGPKVVATGGLASLAAGSSAAIDEYDEFLTLKGLRMIFEGDDGRGA